MKLAVEVVLAFLSFPLKLVQSCRCGASGKQILLAGKTKPMLIADRSSGAVVA